MNDLERSCQQLDYAARSMEQEQDTIDEQRDQAADQKKSNDIVRGSLQVSRSAADALQAYLDRKEMRNKTPPGLMFPPQYHWG